MSARVRWHRAATVIRILCGRSSGEIYMLSDFWVGGSEYPFFRECTRTHNFDRLLEFLVEIASTNPIVR